MFSCFIFYSKFCIVIYIYLFHLPYDCRDFLLCILNVHFCPLNLWYSMELLYQNMVQCQVLEILAENLLKIASNYQNRCLQINKNRKTQTKTDEFHYTKYNSIVYFCCRRLSFWLVFEIFPVCFIDLTYFCLFILRNVSLWISNLLWEKHFVHFVLSVLSMNDWLLNKLSK